jgi:hypothetical protein
MDIGGVESSGAAYILGSFSVPVRAWLFLPLSSGLCNKKTGYFRLLCSASKAWKLSE